MQKNKYFSNIQGVARFIREITDLRQQRPSVRSLTTEAAKKLIRAFVSCRLDCCNSLMPNGLVRTLQSIQNDATPLTTGARRCDHITHVLRQLH